MSVVGKALGGGRPKIKPPKPVIAQAAPLSPPPAQAVQPLAANETSGDSKIQAIGTQTLINSLERRPAERKRRTLLGA
jgi:hypothetical protein